MHRLAILLVALAVAACGGVATIPDTTYYRLPQPATVSSVAAPVSTLPIVVDAFLADGLQNQQAMLYSLDAQGTQLRSYHYQLWAEPPGRMLQRRLIETLRAAGAADTVLDRMPPGAAQMRVRGLLTRFERLRDGSGSTASVAMQLRVESPGHFEPWLLREYRVDEAAAGASVEAYVEAMARAVDRIYAEFLRDLESQRP
jgi:cholesterol transport system auxiliary component